MKEILEKMAGYELVRKGIKASSRDEEVLKLYLALFQYQDLVEKLNKKVEDLEKIVRNITSDNQRLRGMIICHNQQMAKDKLEKKDETVEKKPETSEKKPETSEKKDDNIPPGVMYIGDATKSLNLGIGRNVMFRLLKQKGVLKHNNTPYEKYNHSGYFFVKRNPYESQGVRKWSYTTMVTEKGVEFLNKLAKEYLGIK